MSLGLRLVLLVAVLSSESDAQPLTHARGQHLRRQPGPASSHQQRPLPFSVDTYDEAVVSHAATLFAEKLFLLRLLFLRFEHS